ncbi:MAG: metalloregulator ArsR/SmtB family transcription factor [Lapillicoccus sp.]
MHAFDILGDPVRRRILELLADTDDLAAGDIAATIHDEFGISHPAVSQHLKVLRDAGFTTVTVAGTRRLYAVSAGPWRDIDAWLGRYRRFWTGRLDALDTEISRGNRARRTDPPTPPTLRETR